jgi:arylsulfatase A-like enzyme
VASALGYAKGFASYRETWTEADTLKTEMAKTEAITGDAVRFLGAARPDTPFLLWLHYVNPHAPYTPPPPYDTAFVDARAQGGKALPVVASFRGGIPRQWAVPGKDRLGYYVAQYDGEIAAVDAQVGRVMEALAGSAVAESTVVLLTSDHGESLGEHDYYFDHGEDLFDPSLRVPLIVKVPGGPPGRRSATLASTLDVVPTLLDAVKVSYPADLSGRSLLPAVTGEDRAAPERLYGQNDRNLSAVFDARFKVVATPQGEGRRLALYDRRPDPGETRDVSGGAPEAFRAFRRELELFQDRVDQEWVRLKRQLAGVAGGQKLDADACERLRAMGYVVAECE